MFPHFSKSATFLLIFPFLLYGKSYAQQTFTLSGEVKVAKTGELLSSATVTLIEIPDVGAYSNDYGFYSLSVPQGTYHVVTNFVGYKDDTTEVVLDKDIRLNIKLQEGTTTTQAVVITDKKENDNITNTQVGVNHIDITEIKKVPVLFGEKDILKTIQLLPGIKGAGEGNSGFYVRGGSADQNLILLDEANVYNASHLLGFFSTFNSDAIKDLTIYKGGIPAEYGGRASSVVDIRMKDGNNQRFGATGGIGLIASRLSVEGPIVKEKGSFIVSGRRTYADLFLKLSSDSNLRSSQLYFYDFNAKANYRINDRNKVYASGYFGRDVFKFGSSIAGFGFDWGNKTGTLRWNHLFSDKLFSNTSLVYSDYDYNVNVEVGDFSLDIVSGIKDWNLKQDFTHYVNPKNTLKYGANVIYHTFRPGVLEAGTSKTELDNQYALESALYFANEQTISKKIKINYGLRGSLFNVLGNGKYTYTYDDYGVVTDSALYETGTLAKTYGGIEPRLSANYTINDESSIKFGAHRAYQYLHLLSNSTSTQPTDLWVPASTNIKPQIGNQVDVGYYRNFAKNKFEASAEIYYKSLENQIDYRTGAQLSFNKQVEGELLYGKGRAYGLELFLKKRTGKLTGWISYTLSRTERSFAGIDNGKWFAAKQDRTHDLSIVAMYDISPKFNVSATWVYYTGNAVTFPSGRYIIDGQLVSYYTERNGYRMPAYHRLDLGANWIIKKTEKHESSLNLSIYNAYSRKNAYSITFQPKADNPMQTEAVKTTLFRIVPAFTYNFTF